MSAKPSSARWLRLGKTVQLFTRSFARRRLAVRCPWLDPPVMMASPGSQMKSEVVASRRDQFRMVIDCRARDQNRDDPVRGSRERNIFCWLSVPPSSLADGDHPEREL